MDLISLRYFAETARQRSISKAAAALGVVQPALTRRIQLLEEKAGAPLLARHRRGVEPTEAGLLVLERAGVILRMVEQLEAEVRSHGTEPAGQVAFGFPASIGILLAGKLLSECGARYPRIDLLLHESYSPGVRSALLSGQLDIGIMSCEARHPELLLQPLFKEAAWLMGRPQDWKFAAKTIQPSNLRNMPLLIGSFMRTLLEKHLGGRDGKLQVVANVDSYSLAREALRAGAGFMVAPVSALDRELRSGELVGAPIKGVEVTRGLFRHRERPLSRAAETLTSLIIEQVAKLCASQPERFRKLSGTQKRSQAALD